MPLEIERKFLVAGDAWRAAADQGVMLRQGYLTRGTDGAVVRVRLAGARGFLTIKGPGLLARAEFEYAIPPDDATTLLETLCARPLIEKRRHTLSHAGQAWTVDLFAGHLAGLLLAEAELPTTEAALVLPAWIGAEVTDDARYSNAALAVASGAPCPHPGPLPQAGGGGRARSG